MSSPAGRAVILDQVRRLTAIPADAAPEGLIFYCARMLDGMCADLIAKIGQKPSANIFSNLMTVEALRLIDNISKELAHTLRRMGNGVRHTLADSTKEDTRLAVVLTRELALWYEGLEHGAEFADALARLEAEIDPSWGVVAVVNLLSSMEKGVGGAAEDLLNDDRRPDILASRFLATLCVEALIACGRATDAEEILNACAKDFGSDQRHQQLRALILSRTGRLDEAVKAADDLLKSYADDDETAGIAGGIYKRRWDKDRSQTKALVKAHDLYRKQWERGKKINAYLGVNAAATAVYLDKNDVATEIARVVVSAMDTRDKALAAAQLRPQDGGVADYYDKVSRGEALLISGDWAGSHAAYQNAFRRYGTQLPGHIQGTKSQAQLIADKLGVDDPAA